MSKNHRVSVVAIEDNLDYLGEISLILQSSSEIDFLGGYSTVKEAIENLPLCNPDVVLLDLKLPDGSGLDVIRGMSKFGLSYIILTVFDDDVHLFSALNAGASGYFLKDELSPGLLVSGIMEFYNGGAPMSYSIAKKILKSFEGKASINMNLRALTERELQILSCLTKGHGAKKIADMLSITYSAVRTHQKNIYRKLHVRSDLEAVSVYRTANY